MRNIFCPLLNLGFKSPLLATNSIEHCHPIIHYGRSKQTQRTNIEVTKRREDKTQNRNK